MIKIVITYTKDEEPFAKITGLAKKHADIPLLMEHMLATEVARSVSRGGTHTDVTVTLSATGSARTLWPRPPAGPIEAQRINNAHTTRRKKQVEDIARRNGVYTEPAPHMLDYPKTIEQHTTLLEFISHMPCQISGLDYVKQEAHRLWWSWYDNRITNVAVTAWVEKQANTVRLWLAEWLMVRFETFDFAGRQERLRIQQWHNALKNGRMSMSGFDAKVSGSMTKLQQLLKK